MPNGREFVVLMRSPARPRAVIAQSVAVPNASTTLSAFPSGRPLMRIPSHPCGLRVNGQIVLYSRFIGGWRLLLGARGFHQMARFSDDFVNRPLAAILRGEL